MARDAVLTEVVWTPNGFIHIWMWREQHEWLTHFQQRVRWAARDWRVDAQHGWR